MLKELSNYEKKSLNEIRIWKYPPIKKENWLHKATNIAKKPLSFAGEQIMQIPGIEHAIEKSVGGLVSSLNDFAQWSVRQDEIYKEYGENNLTINSKEDIFNLDLESVDKTIGYLATKYKALAMSEGAATGAVGLPGIALDIPALVLLNLRAIGEYATYCGFDVSHEQERLFAMQVLALASSPTDASKQVAMSQLIKIAGEVAKKKTWKELERHAFVQMVQHIAKSLGVQLTKAKLAQVVPATGAIIGGGFNAYYTTKVCTAANFLYRERFLAEKYGPQILLPEQ
jgi:hypothetical protein